MPSKSPKQSKKEKPLPSTIQRPNWPPLKPLVPTSDLLLSPLVPDQIYLIHNLLTSTLCRAYVSFLSSSVPMTTTPGKPKRGEAVRVNDRFQIDDEIFAERLWRETGLREIVERGVDDGDDNEGGGRPAEDIWGGQVLGLNPNIRIYRYVPGQFFAQHCAYSLPSTTKYCKMRKIGLTTPRRRLRIPPIPLLTTHPWPHNMDTPHLPHHLLRGRNRLLS